MLPCPDSGSWQSLYIHFASNKRNKLINTVYFSVICRCTQQRFVQFWLVGLSNWTLCCSSRVILNKRICKCSGYISTLSSAEAHCVDQNSRQSAGGRMEGSGSGRWPTNSPIVGLQKRGRKERVNTDVIVGGWCWTLLCPGMKTHSCTQQTCKHTSTTLINNSLLLQLESNKCHFLVGVKRKRCEKPKIIWAVKQTLHSLLVVVPLQFKALLEGQCNVFKNRSDSNFAGTTSKLWSG